MTIPTWLKALHNQRYELESVYMSGDWQPVLYESAIHGMENLYDDPESWKPVREWIDANFQVVVDRDRLEESRKSWQRIHEQLNESYQDRMNLTYIAPQRGGKTWLGSQLQHVIYDERIPEVRPLPDVRDLGWTAGPFHFNEAGGLSESLEGSSHWRRVEESPALQLKEWLQHRGVCRRALSCGMA